MEQTAVEFLINKVLQTNHLKAIFEDEIKQAKEMEKQQIIDAFDSGLYDGGENVSNYNLAAEEYYNETFKTE